MQYLKHCVRILQPSTVERYEYNLEAILPALPPRVAQVTTQLILSYRERRLVDEVSPRTDDQQGRPLPPPNVRHAPDQQRHGSQDLQELLRHKPLAMNMNLYAKIHAGTKREAAARLPHGEGVQLSKHLVQLPSTSPAGHNLATRRATAAG
jgi:hypothetical protein